MLSYILYFLFQMLPVTVMGIEGAERNDLSNMMSTTFLPFDVVSLLNLMML